MVITVTLNPAMDKTLSVNNLSIGAVNRVENFREDIGGKGINVSKVLKNFGVQSMCTGFLGGVLEKIFIDELNRRKISHNFVHVDENTRTNIKIVDEVNNTFTDINEPGPSISNEKLKEFINTFEKMCKPNDIVVLSGGVNASVPKDIYYKLTLIAKSKGALVIMDADGELLQEGIKAKPNIIKPNNHELKKLLNVDEISEEQMVNAAKQLLETGIEKIMISLGDKGAIFVTDRGAIRSESVKVHAKSTVGAGDSMVAAIVYSIIQGFDDEKTLEFATACGAASVSLEGTEACSLKQVTELTPKVNIKKWE